MVRSLGLILVSVLFAVGGQLLLKQGMNRVGSIELSAFWTTPVPTVWRIFSNPLILAGLFLYVFSTAVWLVVLSQMDLSYAYPMLAFMYVLIPMASRLFLGERIPAMRWLGIVVVCVGVLIVARE